MKFFAALLVTVCSSLAFSADAIPKTDILLRPIFNDYPSVQVLNGALQSAPQKNCTVVVTRRNGLLLGDYQDKSVDLAFFVDGKIEGAVHLAAQLVPFATAYEAELEVNVISSAEVRIFTSIGHMTDQFIGYNGFEWILKRVSPEVLNITLNTSWADDDGMSGSDDFTCIIKSAL